MRAKSPVAPTIPGIQHDFDSLCINSDTVTPISIHIFFQRSLGCTGTSPQMA